MTSISNRQLTSATALAQLLADHPELPALDWTISARGVLTGSKFSIEDLPAMAAAVVGPLGGSSYESSFTSGKDGLPHPVVHVDAVWRDVAVAVTLGGLVPVGSSAPAGLPLAWSAAAVSA